MDEPSYFYTYVNFIKFLISMNVDTGISSIENAGNQVKIKFSFNEFNDATRGHLQVLS